MTAFGDKKTLVIIIHGISIRPIERSMAGKPGLVPFGILVHIGTRIVVHDARMQ